MAASYSESALRHFADAEKLAETGRLDGAGHLIGFATECAIKYAVEATRPAVGAYHLHLPRLAEDAKKAFKAARGRQISSVFKLLQHDGFMAGWRVDARYEANGHVDFATYNRWRNDASRTIAAANLRRIR